MATYNPIYEPTELCKKVFQALWAKFDKSSSYHNERSRRIMGGATYEVGSESWHTTFLIYGEAKDWPPYVRLREHIEAGRLKDGDILVGGESRAPIIKKGKTLEIAKTVMKEEFGMDLLDCFEIGKRAYYLWVKK